MSRIRVGLDELLPVKQAARGLSAAIECLTTGEAVHLVLTRRNQPVAVLLTVERYEEPIRATQHNDRERE
jgi:PHD/YefM family antitoxin component YafN of YafNO toxin-antitoxin module